MSDMEVKHRNLPEGRSTPDVQVEGHVFVTDGLPWLAHTVVRNIGKPGAIGLGRDTLAGLLLFVAVNDPDMYRRMGEHAYRERRRSQ